MGVVYSTSQERSYKIILNMVKETRGRPKRRNKHLCKLISNLFLENPLYSYTQIQQILMFRNYIKASVSFICKTVKVLKFSRKRLSKYNLKQNDKRVKKLREKWVRRNWHKMKYKNIIFIDESHIDSENSTKMYGVFPKGTPSNLSIVNRKRKTYSLICSIWKGGVLCSKLFETSNCGVSQYDFGRFLRKLFLKLDPNKEYTLVIDNARIHHSRHIKRICMDFHRTFCYLPPYSADFNAIEHFFAVVKSYLRNKLDYSEPLLIRIKNAMSSVRTKSIQNIIKHTVTYYQKFYINNC